MTTIDTTEMSSKGQIEIPEGIRQKLGLKPGAKFLIIGDKDTLILKTMAVPRIEEFDDLIKTTHAQAKAARLKRSDIAKAISAARGRK